MNFLLLIKVFFNYSLYKEYREYIEITKDMREVYYLFKALDEIYENIHTDISFYDYALWVQTKLGKDYEIFLSVIEKENISEAIIEQTLLTAKTHAVSLQIAKKALLVSEGKLPYPEFMDFLSKQKIENKNKKHTPVTHDLLELLDNVVNSPGLFWRLKCLNRSLGPIRKGDFGFIFARPESGKTTFLCSESSYMVNQPSLEGPILWVNNEEEGEKVQLRFMQSYFGLSTEEINTNKHKYKEQYNELVGNKFILMDDSNFSKRDVESIIDEYKPGLIIVDQLHKIKGFDSDREDLRLGQVFGWGRELAKQYAPLIGVNQADGSGENKRYLTMDNVANAKTAIQAEADYIIGIGQVHDPGYEYVRFLNIPKNKLTGNKETKAHLRHGKFEVLIHPEIGRYND